MSFLNRFKGASSTSNASSPSKKDPNAADATPLQKLLANVENVPVREDGSDKFFGMENFGSTCYCNSIVQCLYYSAPFRDRVINYPTRAPPDIINNPKRPQLLRLDTAGPNGTNGAVRSPGPTTPLSPTGRPVVRAGVPLSATVGSAQAQKPEENKDSPEYKKKQALLAGPMLTMDYENAEGYGMRGTLFTALKDIFETVAAHKSRTGIISPHKLLEILSRENEMFRTPMHQDAHEFLNLLLNEVVENVEEYSKEKQKANDSANGSVEVMQKVVNTITQANSKRMTESGWVRGLFEGMLTSETRCLTCECISQRDEAFLDLSVDLEQHSSISSCLRKFSEEEMLCERNKFHCDNCGGLQEAEKRMKIKRLPRVLALHLKRFKYTEDLQRLQKLFHRVVYPYHLRLFNTTDDAEDPDRLYELYAVVVHIGGGPYHGHYVSIVKTEDRGWLLFDDEMVEPVDKDYVRNFFGGDNALACAYVLFYQETTLEAVQKEQEADGLDAEQQHVPLSADRDTKQNGLAVVDDPHPCAVPPTPAIEEANIFASLDHAATAPVATTSPMPGAPNAPVLPEQHTSAVFPGLTRSVTQRWSEAHSRKAQEREAEKARRIAEKEAKAQEKEKAKQKQRDGAATEGIPRDSDDAVVSGTVATKGPKEKENGTKGGMFRQSSIMLKHKPKLWGLSKDSKDAAATPASPPPVPALPCPNETPLNPGSPSSVETVIPLNSGVQSPTVSSPATSPPPLARDAAVLSPGGPLRFLSPLPGSGGAPESKKEGKEKDDRDKRLRFSLGRKKSSALK